MHEKNKAILDEFLDEIESALKDPKGVSAHQRRIAFALSLGTVSLIEDYLAKNNILKGGSKINHLWLKKKKDNVKRLISRQITCPIENISLIDEILDLAYRIEEDRNQQAYGKSVSEETIKNKISLFFDLKKKVEND